MARQFKNQKVRTLRESPGSEVAVMPRAHRKFILALLEACITERIGFYVGPFSPYGSIKLKFWAGDEQVEDFLSKHDDPAAEIARIAEALSGAVIAREVTEYGARLEAQERLRGSEPSQAIPQVSKTRGGP
jgi:hypothetical protein